MTAGTGLIPVHKTDNINKLKSLFPALVHYGNSDMLPMHMPGHKRRADFMGGIGKYDITEIDGFDDLHHPGGILKEAMAAAADLYESDVTYFLVNGSTCGILAAIAAVTKPREKILIVRNCHKAVINAVTLRELDPVYVYPKKCGSLGVTGSVDPEEIRQALAKEKDIRAVVMTSPTYEGVASDIAAIAVLAHNRGIPLIVDAAHGAHFRFGADFPAAALDCGADLVVESLHKTLPSLTQTALLHVKSTLVDDGEVAHQLQIFQSSSPSYLLLASITQCLALMAQDGAKMMATYSENLCSLRQALDRLATVTLLRQETGFFDYDPGKIVFGVEGYGGRDIAALLQSDFHVETEMAAPRYLLAMTSVCDTKETLLRFQTALSRLCHGLPPRKAVSFPNMETVAAEKVMTPAAVRERTWAKRDFRESSHCVAAENLYLYPPGTPLVVAGERISPEIITAIQAYVEMGFMVHGVNDRQLFVVSENMSG
ncbi:MAG TPA: aminotransferase class I/II-fold pyridoxal phosphate-dependent enzyme [Clostridiales bacterium]|nr:aminotransferase class I/II-fold pyridoxal phosphate-dependent enzyme [Clostridiales bacterium]